MHLPAIEHSGRFVRKCRAMTRLVDNYCAPVLAIVQTRAYIRCITGKDAIWRQWLRDATALPPFTAGERDVVPPFLQSHACRPDAGRQRRASAAPQGGRTPSGA